MSDEPYDRDEARRRLEALGKGGTGASDAPERLDPPRRNSGWDGGAASGTLEERQQREKFVAAMEASAGADVVECRRRFEQSGNPVYVWIALLHLNASGAHRYRTTDGALERHLKLPDWCADYLVRASANIFDLADGQKQKSPSQAMSSVTQALGFTNEEKKYNAFRDFQKDGKLEELGRAFQIIRRAGISYSDAMAELAPEFPVMDRRTLEKKIAAAQRHLDALGPDEDPPSDVTGKT